MQPQSKAKFLGRVSAFFLTCAWSLIVLTPAFAKDGYQAKIPNGGAMGAKCENCHTTAPALNPFGMAIPGGNWTAAICAADSDGDGQTNGAELGDPCCTWSAGATPGRTSDISLPGDMTSKATAPTTPACAGSDAGSTTGTMLDEDTCTCRVHSNKGPSIRHGLLFGAAAMALMFRRARRRKRSS